MADEKTIPAQILILAEEIAGLKDRVAGASAAAAAARKEVAAESAALREELAATADWSAEIADVQSKIGELKEAIDALQESEREPQVWDWTEMDRDAAVEAWETLRDWVDDVANRQLGLVGWSRAEARQNNKANRERLITQIPPCWRQHRDVVFLLSPLCQEWIRVFKKASYGTPAKALDWYDRHVPGVVNRIALSSAHECMHSCKGWSGWDGEGVLDEVAAEDIQADAQAQDEHRKAQLTARQQQQQPQRQPVDAAAQQPRRPAASSSWSPTPPQDRRQ